MIGSVSRHSFPVFLVLAFAISWAGFILDSPEVFVFGPSLAGVILVQLTYGREARRNFWRRVIDAKRISTAWYLLIILTAPVLLAASILMDVMLGGSFPEVPFLGRIASQPLLIFVLVIQVLLQGPLSEELGWRGYAQDAVLKKWGALRSGLMIGVFWSAWHLPLFAWASYGSAHYQWGWFTTMFWIFMIYTVLLSVLMTWAYLQSRASILSAILIHFFFNLTLGLALPLSERVWSLFSILLGLTVALIVRSRPAALTVKISPPVRQLAE